MTFQVGDVAILVADASGMFPQTIGQECTIISPLALCKTFPLGMRYCYGILLQDGSKALAQPYELRRRPPPSDSIKLGRWDECPWRPEIIESET